MKDDKADLYQLSWPASRLTEALEAIATKCGLPVKLAELPNCDSSERKTSDEFDDSIKTLAVWLGFEVEPIQARYPELPRLLRIGSPMLIKQEFGNDIRFLAIVRGSQKQVQILNQNRDVRWISLERVRSLVSANFETPIVEEINRLLQVVGVPRHRQHKTARAILAERLVSARFTDCWLLQMPPQSSFRQLSRREKSIRKLIVLTSASLVAYSLGILSWVLAGRSAFNGQFDRAWFIAWILVLATIVPIRAFSSWLQASLAIKTGCLLKRGLLSAALRLDPDAVRKRGSGGLMSLVIESEAVESLAMSGAGLALFAVIELLLGMWILWVGTGSWLHVSLLAAWLIPTFMICRYYYKRRLDWTTARLSLTDDLIERMVGYRTRIAQESHEHWHDAEDRSLEQYLKTSKTMDRVSTILMALIPRGWLIIGLAALAAEFTNQNQSPVSLAITMGGIIFCYRALAKIAPGISLLGGAAIAWKSVGPAFRQTNQPQSGGLPGFALAPIAGSSDNGAGPLLELSNIFFHYDSRPEPVLRNCSLKIRSGDRLLLEGPSGSGKSTLASILTGLRPPTSGLALVHGLDRQTLGFDGWRKRVVAAPQFQENYVLTETFAFNLLMGRRWPPRAEDFSEAKEICDELGLTDLLNRMPAGMWQMVGETGWQLSHGERSRLYIARALLQDSDLVVLDESFASLDPKTLVQAYNCVLQRARTIVLIAHP